MPGGSRGELQGTVSGPADAPVFDGSIERARHEPGALPDLGDAATRCRPTPRATAHSACARKCRSRPAVGARHHRRPVRHPINGAAHYRWEGRPEVSLTLEGPQLDVRPFVPAGASLGDMFNLAGAYRGRRAAVAARRPAQDDRYIIRVNAGQLITSGRTYRDVALELELKGGNLRLPVLRVSATTVSAWSSRARSRTRRATQGLDPRGRGERATQGVLPLAELLGMPKAFRPERAARRTWRRCGSADRWPSVPVRRLPPTWCSTARPTAPA